MSNLLSFDLLSGKLPEYEIRPITAPCYNDVFALYQTNSEFFSCEQDHPVTREECVEGIGMRPPGTEEGKKHFIGFYRKGHLDAVLDYIDSYPNAESGFIGLFIVNGNKQRNGIGRSILSALFSAMEESGVERVELAVILENKKAHAFWQRMGLKEIRRCVTSARGRRDWSLIVMEKWLDGSETGE